MLTSPRHDCSIKTRLEGLGAISHLSVSRASVRHSGVYTCSVSDTISQSLRLNIVDESNAKAIINNGSATPITFNNNFALTAFCLFVIVAKTRLIILGKHRLSRLKFASRCRCKSNLLFHIFYFLFRNTRIETEKRKKESRVYDDLRRIVPIAKEEEKKRKTFFFFYFPRKNEETDIINFEQKKKKKKKKKLLSTTRKKNSIESVFLMRCDDGSRQAEERKSLALYNVITEQRSNVLTSINFPFPQKIVVIDSMHTHIHTYTSHTCRLIHGV